MQNAPLKQEIESMFSFKSQLKNRVKMKNVLTLLFCALISMGFSQQLDEWDGTYSGKLEIVSVKGKKTEVPMQLKIEKVNDSLYNWTLIYGDSAQDVRPYQLKHKDENRFMMDENNGILLDVSLFENELISLFEVQGSILWVNYTLLKKGIEMRITSSVNRQESGGTAGKEDQEEIPVVGSYTTVVSQFAFLKKE